MRYLAILVLLAAAALRPAGATTSSTDFTDLWWNAPDASEDGWGVNVVQQGDVVFATFFVYGPDNSPRWYVASNAAMLAAPAGQTVFTGPLYTTTGTPFTLPWNPANRSFREVGTVRFTFTSATQGTLEYTVDGATVIKSVKRQTWRGNFLAGNYYGGATARGFNCAGGGSPLILIFGELQVSHTASAFQSPTLVVKFHDSTGRPSTCTYTGVYSQEGKLGSMDGNFTCQIQGESNPPAGTFSLREIHATRNGMSARYTGRDQFCNGYEGFFGGPRDVL